MDCEPGFLYNISLSSHVLSLLTVRTINSEGTRCMNSKYSKNISASYVYGPFYATVKSYTGRFVLNPSPKLLLKINPKPDTRQTETDLNLKGKKTIPSLNTIIEKLSRIALLILILSFLCENEQIYILIGDQIYSFFI